MFLRAKNIVEHDKMQKQEYISEFKSVRNYFEDTTGKQVPLPKISTDLRLEAPAAYLPCIQDNVVFLNPELLTGVKRTQFEGLAAYVFADYAAHTMGLREEEGEATSELILKSSQILTDSYCLGLDVFFSNAYKTRAFTDKRDRAGQILRLTDVHRIDSASEALAFYNAFSGKTKTFSVFLLKYEGREQILGAGVSTFAFAYNDKSVNNTARFLLRTRTEVSNDIAKATNVEKKIQELRALKRSKKAV